MVAVMRLKKSSNSITYIAIAQAVREVEFVAHFCDDVYFLGFDYGEGGGRTL
jgi:hypothetical protein